MEKYRLTLSGLIDPFWFNSVSSKRIEAIVQDNAVTIEGKLLKLSYSESQSSIPDGTAVICYLCSYFTCSIKADIEEADKQRKVRKAQSEQEYSDRLNAYRDESIAFNNSLALPFSWRTGFKAVISGLTERSAGNGLNRASVIHIELTEDFKQGRLQRSKGDFLCSKDKGMEYTDSEIHYVDGDNQSYQPKVTCKACLRRAEKYQTTKDTQ